MSVRVRGLDRVADTLRAAGGAVDDLTAENTAAADLLADRVRPGLRRRTGTMRSRTRGVATVDHATVVVDVVYAGPAIYGWKARHIAPGPTRPDDVVEQAAGDLVDLYADGITDRVLSTIKGG